MSLHGSDCWNADASPKFFAQLPSLKWLCWGCFGQGRNNQLWTGSLLYQTGLKILKGKTLNSREKVKQAQLFQLGASSRGGWNASTNSLLFHTSLFCIPWTTQGRTSLSIQNPYLKGKTRAYTALICVVFAEAKTHLAQAARELREGRVERHRRKSLWEFLRKIGLHDSIIKITS